MAGTESLIKTAKGMAGEIERQAWVVEGLLEKIERARASIQEITGEIVPGEKTTDPAEIQRRIGAGHTLSLKTAPFVEELRAAQRQMARERRHLNNLIAAEDERNRPRKRRLPLRERQMRNAQYRASKQRPGRR